MAKHIKYLAGATAIAANTFVKLSSGLTVEQASATAIDCIGVQINASVTGDIAVVCVEGECQVIAGEAVVAGEYIRPGTAGKAFGADAATDVIVGIYYGQEVAGTVETVAATDLITIHLFGNKSMVKA